MVAAILGTRLPGPGTIQLEQDFRFLVPAIPGDTVTVTSRVTQKREADRRVRRDAVCTNQRG